MDIDINESIFRLEQLIRNTKLTQQERNELMRDMAAFRKLKSEWQELKEDGNNI